jgi:hypothetical protein
MEQGKEGDQIILSTLRQIESSSLSGDVSIQSISELSADMIVDIVARSLNIIGQDTKVRSL